ncbi:hypothetical protein F7H86_13755 [Novacetimonas hansenii]
MFTSGNTSPCHHSLHLFVKTDESQQAGIVQKLSDQALNHSIVPPCREYTSINMGLMSFIFRLEIVQSQNQQGQIYEIMVLFYESIIENNYCHLKP